MDALPLAVSLATLRQEPQGLPVAITQRWHLGRNVDKHCPVVVCACSAIVVPLVLFTSVVLLQLLLMALRRPALQVLEYACRRSEFLRHHLGARLPASSMQSFPDVACHVDDADEETPHVAPVPSASSQGSKGSFPSTNMLGEELTSASLTKTLLDVMVATALAVLLFVYITIAKVAFGMLLCVKVGESKQWVLDVRLQCPASKPYSTWSASAIALGVLLLTACIAWPVCIAWVLVREAHRGKLLRIEQGLANVEGASTDVDVAAAHISARLAVRYADYNVDYAALNYATSTASMTGWYRSLTLLKSALKLLRVYAVLCWDSIMDLHRFVIALISLCVMLHELHQLLLMTLALGSYLLLVLLVNPWRAGAVWRLQVLALSILLGSCLGIMACTVTYIPWLAWLIIVTNALYLGLILFVLLRCVMREIPRLADLREYLRKKFRKLRLKQSQAA